MSKPGSSEGSSESGFSREERALLDRLHSAESLSELKGIMGAESEHEAYFEAKKEWYRLREKELLSLPPSAGLPGDTVVIDGREFHVHGITHADTDEEREFLRRHVSEFVDNGAVVYCEQGIRRMYFSDFDDVYEMDDYRWALGRCDEFGVEPKVESGSAEKGFVGVVEGIDSLGDEIKDAVFSVIDWGERIYGDEFKHVLGDLASDFMTSHESMSTGEDFESFVQTRQASKDPRYLVELQNYYKKRLLPEPVEREWLRRHDGDLEAVTYARNERMADYVVYHADDTDEVHVVVGAAHQPGVVYYLEKHRDGKKDVESFEHCG